MLSFFKIFGQGVLIVILSPFIALLLALYAVYCIIVFIYMAIRNVIIFFSGGTPLGDMKEDVEAKKILMARQEKEAPRENIYSYPTPQPTYEQPSQPAPTYQQPTTPEASVSTPENLNTTNQVNEVESSIDSVEVSSYEDNGNDGSGETY